MKSGCDGSFIFWCEHSDTLLRSTVDNWIHAYPLPRALLQRFSCQTHRKVLRNVSINTMNSEMDTSGARFVPMVALTDDDGDTKSHTIPAKMITDVSLKLIPQQQIHIKLRILRNFY